jgi:hypothetical protein
VGLPNEIAIAYLAPATFPDLQRGEARPLPALPRKLKSPENPRAHSNWSKMADQSSSMNTKK